MHASAVQGLVRAVQGAHPRREQMGAWLPGAAPSLVK